MGRAEIRHVIMKCLGGLGFKDLVLFNDVLLGLQAWRLICEPHVLYFFFTTF